MKFLFLTFLSSHGLTTYKELCSLASDLNQPDLVYKFMNLANHHAMWNSRKVPKRLHPAVERCLIQNQFYSRDPPPAFREQLSAST